MQRNAWRLVLLASFGASVTHALPCHATRGVPLQSQENFMDKANAITQAIQIAWGETLTYPQLAMAFLTASEVFPGRKEFQKFASNRYWNPQQTIFELEWVAQVSNSQRHSFETFVRAQVPPFEIFTFNNGLRIPQPENFSTSYYPILYCYPPDEILLGLDLNDAVEGPAINKAKATGQATTAPPFILRGSTPGIVFKMGMTMYMPLFQNSTGLTEERTDTFSGCLISVFLFHPLVKQVLEGMDLQNMDVFLFWIQIGDHGNESTYVAHFESGPTTSMPQIDPASALQVTPENVTGDIVTNFSSQFDIYMADRIFRVKVRARTGSVETDVLLLSPSAESSVLQECTKMSMCAQAVQGDPLLIVAEDAAQREISYQVVGASNSTVCSPRGLHCNITIMQSVVGLYILEVFADGAQVMNSPVLFSITTRICPDRRMADNLGNCICNLKTDFDVGGTCVSFKVLFPSVIVPTVVLVTILVLLYLTVRLAQEEMKWKVNPKELVFSDNEVLGSGTQGDVVRAVYRGTPVAVKCFRPRDGDESGRHDTSELQGSSQTLDGTLSGGSSPMRAGRSGLIRNVSFGETNVAVLESHELQKAARAPPMAEICKVGSSSHMLRSSRMTSRGFGAYKQLRQDVKMLTAIRHPAITTLMGVADLRKGQGPNSGLCIVMELMELGSLWDLLHNKTFPIQPKMALQFLRDIARGMRFLHEASPPMLHGDLKSGNVLVDRSFSGKISDFGLTVYQKSASGTSLWMSPECLAGISGNTPQSDVWSFGVVVYEILTRQCPYDGEDAQKALAGVRKCKKRLPTPPGCSAEVAALMNDCLAFDPAHRPPFAELDRRLDALDVALMTSPAFADDVDKLAGPGARRPGGNVCSEEILADLFPAHVAEALMRGEKVPPEHKDMITMFFSDIVGFTTISADLPAEKVSNMLDRLFERLDLAAESLGVYKIETIGDAYLCATNITVDQRTVHAAVMARFALEAVAVASTTPIDLDEPAKGTVQIRVGLCSGPCMASVVGRKSPKYTLFGDTINTASRMESHSLPGRVQCTARTAELIRLQDPGAVALELRGSVDIKGKGQMLTYWILPAPPGQSNSSAAAHIPLEASSNVACVVAPATPAPASLEEPQTTMREWARSLRRLDSWRPGGRVGAKVLPAERCFSS